jgi:hypothetical protein
MQTDFRKSVLIRESSFVDLVADLLKAISAPVPAPAAAAKPGRRPNRQEKAGKP